ncbi:Uncharacterized protein APZ42_015180 [Daphnia magna]|uniref:Uncharacterized protein n=1 Tax=Daphnia magna TaxID=35525 RepID=A0A162P830_9CRUS|nr:Uncharacterized protein APZ42_015180 [Daphnia magna]
MMIYSELATHGFNPTRPVQLCQLHGNRKLAPNESNSIVYHF